MRSYCRSTTQASNQLIGTDYNNLGPRVGLAYQIAPRVVVRSAFGVFYNGDENGPYSNPSPGFNPPYFASQAFNAPCSQSSAAGSSLDCSVPGLTQLSQGFPATSLTDPNTPSLFSLQLNLRTPYVSQWHGTVQYQIAQNTVLDVGYVGSKGTKLYTFKNLNQASPTADASAPYAPRRSVPLHRLLHQLSQLAGLVELQRTPGQGAAPFRLRRISAGQLHLQPCAGDSSNANLGAQNNDSFRWSARPNIEYGNLDFDVRHRFLASYIWDLPIGKDKHFASNINSVANLLIGNWQLSGIVTLSSGTWFTVTDANANFANSDGQQRPDFVPGQNQNGKPCVPGTFFNTCAFTDPQPGSFGNVSLNSLRGPGYKNWDVLC